jgi:hypothetical protein
MEFHHNFQKKRKRPYGVSSQISYIKGTGCAYNTTKYHKFVTRKISCDVSIIPNSLMKNLSIMCITY